MAIEWKRKRGGWTGSGTSECGSVKVRMDNGEPSPFGGKIYFWRLELKDGTTRRGGSPSPDAAMDMVAREIAELEAKQRVMRPILKVMR